MRKIIIAHTCFNERFSLSEQASIVLDGFGYSIKLAQVDFNNEIKLISTDNSASYEREYILFVISDALFEASPDDIKQSLLKSIVEDDYVYIFWHKRYGTDFLKFIKNSFPSQLLTERGCNHEEWEPFFKLKKIVESSNEEEFSANLKELRNEITETDALLLERKERYSNTELVETVIKPKLKSGQPLNEKEEAICRKLITVYTQVADQPKEILKILNQIL